MKNTKSEYFFHFIFQLQTLTGLIQETTYRAPKEVEHLKIILKSFNENMKNISTNFGAMKEVFIRY